MNKCVPSRYLAEMFGTFLLVFLGCGSAILAGPQIGFLGVSICFGITLLFLIYSIGHVSGCHLNPAVTLCLTFAHKFEKKDVLPYIASQLLGAALAGYCLFNIASGNAGFDIAQGFALNGYGEHSPKGYDMISGIIMEVIATTVLLYVILTTTCSSSASGFAGIFIGVTLIALHLVAIPVTNASLNFARTFGVAVIHGGWALTQMWLFLGTNIIAAILAVLIFKATHCNLTQCSK
ncbi:MAG: aquaporin [Proteobacteria bacterium]|nr:aquaporin [Pseudomonadota bacterium]